MPFINMSHSIIMNAIASRLAARGHSVSFLWASEFPLKAVTQHPNYTLIEFSTNMNSKELLGTFRAVLRHFESPENISLPFDPETGWLTKLKSYLEIGGEMKHLGESVSVLSNAICKVVLSDYHLMARLREQHFDIALVDDFFCTRCLFLIPHSLGARC